MIYLRALHKNVTHNEFPALYVVVSFTASIDPRMIHQVKSFAPIASFSFECLEDSEVLFQMKT